METDRRQRLVHRAGVRRAAALPEPFERGVGLGSDAEGVFVAVLVADADDGFDSGRIVNNSHRTEPAGQPLDLGAVQPSESPNQYLPQRGTTIADTPSMSPTAAPDPSTMARCRWALVNPDRIAGGPGSAIAYANTAFR